MTDNRTTELLLPCPRCPACWSSDIVMADDFERDLTILKCQACGEMFAISNVDIYDNSRGWVFNEWANSFVSQKRLCGKAVKQCA